MATLDTAILLAAGEGSRLRAVQPSKPLCPVGGVALIDHAIGRLASVGVERVIVVLGYEGERIAAHLAARAQPLAVETVWTADYRLPNGTSALAAAPHVGPDGALLMMCDHLVEPALYARMAAAGPGPGLRLGIDRRLGHRWIDPEDVTCVRTAGQRIVAIGKGLEPHDCYDTGVFAVGPAFFAALAGLESPSISAGVQLLADEGQAEIVECSDLDWLDVDNQWALDLAEEWLAGAAA